MPWLLAEEATGLGDLIKIGGSIGGTAAVLTAVKVLYDLWRNHRKDSIQDANDKADLEKKRGENKLALNAKEEEQVDAQLQRVINQQDKLITKLQTRNEHLQTANNELTGKLAAATTKNEFLERQLAEERRYVGEIRDQRDVARKKYYMLKNGAKPDSDVPPPGTETIPEHLQ